MKVLAELSGGIASAAALIRACEHFGSANVRAIFYAYNQPAMEAERRSAERIAHEFGVPLSYHVLHLGLKSHSRIKEHIPYLHMIMAMHSINWAASSGDASIVVGANHASWSTNDPYRFRDSTYEFYDRLRTLVSYATEPGLPVPGIATPIEGWSKAQLIQKLRLRGIDPENLWTCFGPGPIPCGGCYKCREYEEAKKALTE